MIEHGICSEDEMILEFLRSEVNSPRFKKKYLDIILRIGHTQQDLVDDADLSSEVQNAARIKVLGYTRGYKTDELWFRGFPSDIAWRHSTLQSDQLNLLTYGKSAAWLALSEGTRRAIDGAKNVNRIPIEQDINRHISTIAKLCKHGEIFPKLIAVRSPGSSLILVEGHARATAYALAGIEKPIELILGSSPSIASWEYY